MTGSYKATPSALSQRWTRFRALLMTGVIGLMVLSLFLQGTLAIAVEPVQLGSRPLELARQLPQGSLRSRLEACQAKPVRSSPFSIAHRGAPLRFPEHTREGYVAAARMGAGIIECDVTFTRDQALVCRHSQCDLHTTTNILETSLAGKCTEPPDFNSGKPFTDVRCCTSDLTLAEFASLRGKVDSGNRYAKTLEEYFSLAGTPRADLQDMTGTLLSHRESIELFLELGVKMIPELKEALVPMPFGNNYSQQDYAQALVDEYLVAGVSPDDVFLQSFNLEDIHYWIKNAPEFGRQATWLDGRYRSSEFDIDDEQSWQPGMQELADRGVKILAPPLWKLLTLDGNDEIAASRYAVAAKAAGLDLVAWTLERSGSLDSGGGWYYQTIGSKIDNDGDIYTVLDVLANEVKVRGVFSDWAETTTYYASCTANQVD